MKRKIWAFLGVAVVLLAAALWLFTVVVDRNVIREAERQSMAWAEYASQRLTRIGALAGGAVPTEAELEAISDIESFGQVFRFKLFGPNGKLRFASENPLAETLDLGDHNAVAARVVETLEPHTVVADGSAKPDRPDLYSETYLPIIEEGRVVATVEVYLDQTDTRAAIQADYAAFGIAISALIAAGFAGPVAALVMVLRRLRYKNHLLDLERARAVEADRSKTKFLANVSHELRTPLNGIVGFADLLDDQPLDAEGREMLNLLKNSGNELRLMVDGLLDMTKIESGEMRLSAEPFDPATVLSEALSIVGPDARSKGLTLELLRSSTGGVRVLGDEQAFRQICLNLLGNAIKFTEKGRVRASLAFDGRGGAGVLTLAVADTGGGIPVEDRDRIFERYYRMRNVLNVGASGTGLGLSIVRSVVEMMGGEIELESALGEGSTFTVTVPLPVVEQDEERMAA